MLLEAFKSLAAEGFTLVVSGPDSKSYAIPDNLDGPHIRRQGVLDQAELDRVAARVDFFLNCKPPSIPDNAGNFPSKLLYYLSFGKPIISTVTAGIPPDVLDQLILLESGSSAELATASRRVAAMSLEEKEQRYREIKEYMIPRRLWTSEASRLVEWLGTVSATAPSATSIPAK